MDYSSKEQFRVISELNEFLSNNKIIGIDEYVQLINVLGSGMATKLRLTPYQGLSSRLSHLHSLCKTALGEDPIFDDQEIVSFESLNPSFSFDCDIILKSHDKLYLIDFTSSEDYRTIIDKTRVLESKLSDPSLIGYNVEAFVHIYKKDKFSIEFPYLCREPVDKSPETYTLGLLESFAYRSDKSNEAFIKNCDQIYEYALHKVAHLDYHHTNYSSTKLSRDHIQLAARAAKSNTVSDICNLFNNINKKQYDPYINVLKEITAQYQDDRSPLIHRHADLTTEDHTLESMLLQLSADNLANCLYHATVFPDKITAIKDDGAVCFIDFFPVSSHNSSTLSNDCGFMIAAKRIRGHYFKILFSYNAMDDQLKRILTNYHKPEINVPKGTKSSMEECIDKIKKAEGKLNATSKIINKKLIRNSHSTIWDKIITLSNLSKKDIGNLGLVSSNLLSSTCYMLGKTVGGNLVSHYYEIVKTFAASIKNSFKDQTYYVGINGPYKSVTISKMSSTQDSFDRSHYCTISKSTIEDSYEDICWKKHIKSKDVSRSHFRSLDNNEVAYYLKLPYYLLSLLTWDIESHLDKGRMDKSKIPEKLTSSLLHSLINRDTFAQAAQQVRYLYTSSLGYGGDSSKIIDKISFIIPRNLWEFIYLTRMIKMGLSLSILRDNDSIFEITESGSAQVVFPHSSLVSPSFTHTVSSMYYCNIFNKFRAFHEISEAFCFNELDQELEVYKKAKHINPLFLFGFSNSTKLNYSNDAYLLSNEFVNKECEFVDSLLAEGPGRFRASGAVIIASSNRYLKVNDSNIRDIFKELGKSPIEACTLRGSMEHGKPSDRNQGCRAASAILEELMRIYDQDPAKINNNSWLHSVFMDNIERTGGDSSIFTFVVNQLTDKTLKYYYRIVQKDQVGNREISVLNAVFRIGALFVENVSRSLSNVIREIDLLEDPDKDYAFETAIKHSTEQAKKDGDILCFDNSDQKRWGPNHMLNFFAAMFYGVLYKERGLLRMIYFICDQTLQKEAKFPESLIHLFAKFTDNNSSSHKLTREGFSTNHGSDTLSEFFRNNSNSLFNNIYSKRLDYGMCQGIFHSTSSIYHAIMCKFVQDASFIIYGKSVSIKSFCTSDDSSRIIKLNPTVQRINAVKKIHSIIINSGILFNIIRNDAKSTFNFTIAEFNSIFFKNGIMATPSLKQRISKIDVGSGSNHVEDYMSILSASANYFTVGGSYVGSYILSLLNLALHTEQWTRWKLVNEKDFYKPVELNGFPVIEPFTTCLSGAAANLYLRSSDICDSNEYANLFASIMTEKPGEYKLSDYFRVPKTLSDDSNEIKIFKNTGALGIHSLVRTDKKLSQFENRHKMSLWNFPDHFLTLKHNASDTRFFLYNIYKNGCMSLYSDSLGVNSFFKRFTDPWVSSNRKCVKISKISILRSIGLDSDIKYSYDDINSAFESVSREDERSLLLSIVNLNNNSEFSANLVDQIIPRFDDSKQIVDFLRSQECSDYISPKFTPATSRITLKGNDALDQEKYTADLIKVLSGEKSRLLITTLYNDHRRFDTLPEAEDCPNLDLKDSILIAENSIFAFNKFIKRNTKMITSGKPDNLSALVTMVLKSRFFEGIGVRLTGNLSLIGDRSNAFAYTSWFKKLNEKSKVYCEESINNSVRALYSDVVKYGLITDSRVLTHKDHFEVADIPLDSKHVKIHSKSRSGFINFGKTWISANATFSFDFDTVQNFFQGRLITRNDFRVGPSDFVRNCSKLYFDITANNLQVFHMLHTKNDGVSNKYCHVFAVESNNAMVDVSISLTENALKHKWASKLADYVNKSNTFYVDRTYVLPNSSDSFVFTRLDTSTVFEMRIPDRTATIALISKDLTIPICHADTKNVSDLKLGYDLNHSALVSSVEIYSNLLDLTQDFKNISPNLKTSLSYILYKTSYDSNISTVNRFLRKVDFPFAFESTIVLDLVRALLLNDEFTTETINTNRLYNYVNNLFKNPEYRDGYVISVSLEEEQRFSLLDFIESDPIYDETESIEDVNILQDEIDDNSDGSIKDVILSDGDFDDIDFEALSDDSLMTANEELYAAFDISIESDSDDGTSIMTSRTGLTVNPNNEFPYGILSSLNRWDRTHKLKQVRGIAGSDNSINKILDIYLTAFRLSGSVPSDLFHRSTNLDFLTLPCSMSDIVSIKKVLTN